MSTPILFSYSVPPDGKSESLSATQITHILESKDLAWVHLDGNNPATENWLRKHITYLDDYVIEALLAQNTRPRLTPLDDGAVIILRGVNMNEDADPEDMVSLRMWVDAHRIITIQRRSLKSVTEMAERMDKKCGPHDAGAFLTQIITRLFEKLEPFIEDLEDQIDSYEERAASPEGLTKYEQTNLIDMRSQAIIFHRYCLPQRDVMVSLRTSEFTWLEKDDRRALQESAERMTRYVEDLEAVRQRAQALRDEASSAISEKLNKNLYVLSLVSAVFLPLGFVTGLLGINVGGMPGADNPLAFWIVCGLCAACFAAQLIVLRFLRWF